jgi:hypothetical protein
MIGRPLMARIAGALLFLSLVATTLPRLIALVNTARTMLPLRYDARREAQMGPWYASVKKLRRQLPANQPVALIAAPRDIDSAVFANYYLFPIRTRLFVGRDNYRNAANDPTLPKTIVAVSSARAERTTYNILRDRDLRAGRRVVAAPQLGAPATAFTLPIAASLDGPAPETFVIEATIVNPSGDPAELRVTLWPKGIVKTISIPPGATAAYYDLVYQLFGVTDRGWMRIESSRPLRGAFYFANRGHGDATLLPNAAAPATAIASVPLHRDSKLFVINPNDAPVKVMVGAELIPIDPHAFISWPITTVPRVSGDVYAFVTTRELNGRTDFLWPAK